MTECPTFTAAIYVGLNEGYNGPQHSIGEVRLVLQAYVDAVGLCVTLTPTEFIYTGNGEPGVIVGLLNYPRFPSGPATIRNHAVAIAKLLLAKFKQERCSIVFPDRTIMLEASDL